MPFVGSIIPKQIAAPTPIKPKPAKKKGEEPTSPSAFSEIMDEAELSVKETAQPQTDRKVADAASEDSDEDRRQKATQYGPNANPRPATPNKSLDLKG
ncbi:MAG: hypothetical protein AAGB34_00085 [Planctomycetota bacterium]